MLEGKGRDGAAALRCALLCFAACEGYDVMLMTDGQGDTTAAAAAAAAAAAERTTTTTSTTERKRRKEEEEGRGWDAMSTRQGKGRRGRVEKVRRLTYAHGWQCGHKLIIMDCI